MGLEGLIREFGVPLAFAVAMYALVRELLRDLRKNMEETQELIRNHIAHLTRAVEQLTEAIYSLRRDGNV